MVMRATTRPCGTPQGSRESGDRMGVSFQEPVTWRYTAFRSRFSVAQYCQGACTNTPDRESPR